VAGSQPESEFEETEHKAAALRRAIEEAVAPRGRRAPSDDDGELQPGDPAVAAAGVEP
jgi:hypothetical protein